MAIVLICAALLLIAFYLRPSPNPIPYWVPLVVAVVAFLALLAHLTGWPRLD